MSRWFRHYAGMMRDDKLVRVAIKSRQSIERVCWVWGAILESAAEIDDAGRYDLDAAEAAYFLRSDETDILAIEEALGLAGRVAENRVVKWSDRQFQSDRSANRQSAYRERKRSAVRSGDVPGGRGDGGVTATSRHGDAPETDTEAKTERKNLSEEVGEGCVRSLEPPAPSSSPSPTFSDLEVQHIQSECSLIDVRLELPELEEWATGKGIIRPNERKQALKKALWRKHDLLVPTAAIAASTTGPPVVASERLTNTRLVKGRH